MTKPDMTDEPRQTLLDRIEERARKAWPLWQWMLFVGLTGLPILLGYVYAAQAERPVWRLPSREYVTILKVQGGATVVLFVLGLLDINMGWSRKLFRQPERRSLPPGPFRLGSAFIGIFYRRWWGLPLLIPAMILFINLVLGDEPVISVSRIFWNSREMFVWFYAVILAVMGGICLVGLIVQQKLKKRDRAAERHEKRAAL